MKHKIGDVVRVKSLNWYNANKNHNGNVTGLGETFINTMSKLCGKLVTISAITKYSYYHISEDKYKYNWTDDMFEEDMNNEIRIEVPEGYCIDEENSTFECIKFKKKSEIQIHQTVRGVRVDTPECSFTILDVEDLVTNGYSSFKAAELHLKGTVLPSKKQWEIIYKHLDEINKLLNNKIEKVCYWASDLVESSTYQRLAHMYYGDSYSSNRHNAYRVRPIINN